MFNRKQKKSQKKHNTSETPQKGGKNAQISLQETKTQETPYNQV